MDECIRMRLPQPFRYVCVCVCVGYVFDFAYIHVDRARQLQLMHDKSIEPFFSWHFSLITHIYILPTSAYTTAIINRYSLSTPRRRMFESNHAEATAANSNP